MSNSAVLWTATAQAPLSMGLSRQEYWSGLPCPSPGDLPNPVIEPRPPTLQVNSLPCEPLGKPKNTGVGSLSLLLQIFPTQELNQGLQHCRSHLGIKEVMVGEGHICGFGEGEFSAIKHSFCKMFSVSLEELMST